MKKTHGHYKWEAPKAKTTSIFTVTMPKFHGFGRISFMGKVWCVLGELGYRLSGVSKRHIDMNLNKQKKIAENFEKMSEDII